MQIKNYVYSPGIVAHACNPSIWEVEAEGLEIQGQFEL